VTTIDLTDPTDDELDELDELDTVPPAPVPPELRERLYQSVMELRVTPVDEITERWLQMVQAEGK